MSEPTGPPSFSVNERERWLMEADVTEIPLLIIGGGITGAGILMDASSRGISALLLEQDDFASGTSSKSTKLIHGGLRYLKNLEWGLVREVGRERSILLKNAPYLVFPSDMVLPIRKGGSLGTFTARLAISLYEWLIGVGSDEKHRILSKNELLREEPSLKPDDLLGGIVYKEYITDDSRLCIEVLKTAIRHGGRAVNYCRVKKLQKAGDIFVLECEDLIENKNFTIKALQVINATGPWVDLVRAQENPSEQARLVLSKGVHLVVDRKNLPVSNAIYFDTPDHRMVFAIPRGNTCYVGTTDTIYRGSISDVIAEETDLNYLLACIQQTFACNVRDTSDVISSWAGLRPLVSEAGKAAGEISRKDEIIYSPDGLISIAGGKLTGFRIMAKKVVDLVIRNLKSQNTTCRTGSLALAGKGEDSPEAVIRKLIQSFGTDKETRIRELVRRYGADAALIARQNDNDDWIRSEMVYCKQYEMALKPEDFWFRRTGDAIFNPGRMKQHAGLNIEFQRF